MTIRVQPEHTLNAEQFAPYGSLILTPDVPGERYFYTDWLGSAEVGAPVFHVNHVAESVLPLTVNSLECHPHASQIFIPLDVSRYVVTVAPSDPSGQPLLDKLQSFILPGTVGVAYGRGIWHAGATVLDRTGHFAVLMWRGRADDDLFEDVPQFTILPAGDADATRTTDFSITETQQ